MSELLEHSIWVVLLVGHCLAAGWLAFLLYTPWRARGISVFWGVVFSVPLAVLWSQTDPVLQGPRGHAVPGPHGLALWLVLCLYMVPVTGSAYGATRLADRVARARRKYALAWTALALTILVPAVLAAWTLRPVSIWTAIQYREFGRIRAMVAKSPELVNARDEGGNTPLHRAAYLGGYEIVEFLASHGADVNARDGGGSTPLALAVRNYFPGCPKTVRVLLEAGADPNLPESNGLTPLSLAEEGRGAYTGVTRMLVEHGAKPAPPPPK